MGFFVTCHLFHYFNLMRQLHLRDFKSEFHINISESFDLNHCQNPKVLLFQRQGKERWPPPAAFAQTASLIRRLVWRSSLPDLDLTLTLNLLYVLHDTHTEAYRFTHGKRPVRRGSVECSGSSVHRGDGDRDPRFMRPSVFFTSSSCRPPALPFRLFLYYPAT